MKAASSGKELDEELLRRIAAQKTEKEFENQVFMSQEYKTLPYLAKNLPEFCDWAAETNAKAKSTVQEMLSVFGKRVFCWNL